MKTPQKPFAPCLAKAKANTLATKMSMQTAATLGAAKWAWSRAFSLMIC